MNSSTFFHDIWIYVRRVNQFTAKDWIAYILWVGLMCGLLFCTSAFVAFGHLHHVQWPAYVWNVPIGTFIFVGAIAFDTIGHRTIYKEELLKGEALVHHITIAAGISSCILLCLAYDHRDFFRIPALVMIILSFVYSLVDEALHWRRYLTLKSDRVEMWSHFFILTGHLIMILSWWHWFENGYIGVKETLEALHRAP